MRTFGVVVALVIAAALAWLLWHQEPAAGMALNPAPSDETMPASVNASQPGSRAALQAEAAAESRPARVAVSAPSERKLARLFGRCVDAPAGAPLAGCELLLNGWPANAERTEAHGKLVTWQDPPKFTTGVDGRFEYSFDPPPPYTFALGIHREGRGTIVARWTEIPPGAQLDLGDVALPSGARVSGRVVDTRGAPQDKVELTVELEGRQRGGERERFLPQTSATARTGPDGTFVIRHCLVAGIWSLRLGSGSVLKAPESIEIEPDADRVTVDVVVVAADALEAIEGIVLDDNDQPVSRVILYPIVPGPGLSTGRDGRFRYVRGEGQSRDPVGFTAPFAPGFEDMRDERRFAWGTKDVVLRVRRALAVEVQALDAATGEPITSFGARCFPDPKASNGWNSGDFELRAKGEHEHGIARIEGVRRGANLLIIEPTDRDAFPPMAPVRFDVTDAGAPRQVVRVPRFATRSLEVVRKDGAPVAGSTVEVLLAVEAPPITLRTRALDRHRIFDSGNMPQALLVQSTRTDAAGRCELRGPAQGEVCLRVLGPGHVPLVERNVSLAGEPLRLVVSQGATLVGKVIPVSLLAELGPTEDEQKTAQGLGKGADAYLRRVAPGLTLVDPKDRQRAVPAADHDRIPLAADGAFRIEGVEPGDWDVRLFYPVRLGSGASTSGAELLARVAGLADGETRELVLDASILVPGELRGLVVLDGVPLANAGVGVRGTRPDRRGGTEWLNGPSVRTDDQGRFTARLQSGDWRVQLDVPRAAPARPISMLLRTVATVRSAESTEQVFRFERQRLSVQLLTPDGKPVANRDVDVAAGEVGDTRRTDANGRFTLDPALPGTMTFSTWPEHLATRDQRLQLWNQLIKEGNGNELEAQRIKLGEFTVPAGEKSAEVTFRLPR